MEANPYPWIIAEGLWKPITFNALAATGLVSLDIFNSDGYYRVRDVRSSYTVPSDSGTLQVEVLTSGQDADGGVDQLQATIDLASTADTPLQGSLILDPTQINPGNRVGLVFGGTLTNLIGLNVTVFLERIKKGI